jgi:hypothetical protein
LVHGELLEAVGEAGEEALERLGELEVGSPLRANVALSALDRRFEDAWNAHTPHQRKRRMARATPAIE